MIVVFMRHGEAEEAGQGVAGQDEIRELTREGKKQTKLVAAALNRLHVRPTVLLTSPLIRAVQTAEIAAEELKRAPCPAISNTLAPGHGWKELRQVILRAAQHDRRGAVVLLCGHQPDLGNCIVEAILGRSGSGLEVQKSAAVCVEWEGTELSGVGRVCLVLDPGSAKRILKIARK